MPLRLEPLRARVRRQPRGPGREPGASVWGSGAHRDVGTSAFLLGLFERPRRAIRDSVRVGSKCLKAWSWSVACIARPGISRGEPESTRSPRRTSWTAAPTPPRCGPPARQAAPGGVERTSAYFVAGQPAWWETPHRQPAYSLHCGQLHCPPETCRIGLAFGFARGWGWGAAPPMLPIVRLKVTCLH